MGTNYYLKTEVCECCGRSDEELHIGKSSGGWCFSLHYDDDEGVCSLDDWLVLFRATDNVIRDEYGNVITPTEMQRVICNRGAKSDKFEKKPYGYESWSDFHMQNNSEAGPNALLRHKIGRHCVGHGAGTWDLIQGEFS